MADDEEIVKQRMGHSQSKTKGASSSTYHSSSFAAEKENHDKLQNNARELPRVHGTSSVTTVDCFEGTSLCLSGGSDGVRIFD